MEKLGTPPPQKKNTDKVLKLNSEEKFAHLQEHGVTVGDFVVYGSDGVRERQNIPCEFACVFLHYMELLLLFLSQESDPHQLLFLQELPDLGKFFSDLFLRLLPLVLSIYTTDITRTTWVRFCLFIYVL